MQWEITLLDNLELEITISIADEVKSASLILGNNRLDLKTFKISLRLHLGITLLP